MRRADYLLAEILIHLKSSDGRDFFDWLNVAASLFTLFIGLYVFRRQFLAKIKIAVEFFQISSFEGNLISLIITNPSILNNIIIKNIYIVFDDFVYKQLEPVNSLFNKKTEDIGIINVPKLSQKRIQFPYTKITFEGKEIDLGSFIKESHRVSFFVVDAMDKKYKIPYKNKKKRSKLSKRQFFGKLTKGGLKHFGHYRKGANDKVFDDSVIYWVTVHNKTNGSSRDILIKENGTSNIQLYNTNTIPKSALNSVNDLTRYLYGEKRKYGVREESFEITALGLPQKFNPSFQSIREIRSRHLGKSVPYNEIFNWILIKKEDRKYMGCDKAKDMPPCGDPASLEWISWNKKLPHDIDYNQDYYLSRNSKRLRIIK